MTRLLSFLGTITLLALIAGTILYAAGWLKFDQNSDRTTIEIESREIEDAARSAVEQGKQTLDAQGRPTLEAIDNDQPESSGESQPNEPFQPNEP